MKNNKGFVLVETLVVTVFVMTVLTLLLVNYTPALSEFERREYSDDIDSKYDLFWIKKMVQSDIFLPKTQWQSMVNGLYSSSSTVNAPQASTYHQIKATDFPSSSRDTFNDLINKLGFDKNGSDPLLYITKYTLAMNAKYKDVNNHNIETGGFFKDYLLAPGSYGRNFDPGLVEYIAHLPDYSNPSLNNAEFRLIAKFKRKIDPNLKSGGDNIYYTYATIEVVREW